MVVSIGSRSFRIEQKGLVGVAMIGGLDVC